MSNIVEMPDAFEHISGPLRRVLENCRRQMDARKAVESHGNPRQLTRAMEKSLRRFDETGDLSALIAFEVLAERQQLGG